MIFRQVLQGIVTQDIACDVLRRLGVIERNTGEMVVFVVVIVRPEGHVLRRNLSYHTRRHNVIGVDRIQTHEVREDLILILVHYSFFFAHINHGEHFLAADRRFVFVVRHHARDEYYEPNKRVEQEDEYTDRSCCEAH